MPYVISRNSMANHIVYKAHGNKNHSWTSFSIFSICVSLHFIILYLTYRLENCCSVVELIFLSACTDCPTITPTLTLFFPLLLFFAPCRHVYTTRRNESVHDARADAEQQSECLLPAQRRCASGHIVLTSDRTGARSTLEQQQAATGAEQSHRSYREHWNWVFFLNIKPQHKALPPPSPYHE